MSRSTARGRRPGPGRVQEHVAGQQVHLPHTHGHRRRRGAHRAGTGGAAVRRGPGHRRADPQVRLFHHAADPRSWWRRTSTCRQNLSVAAHLIHGSSEERFTHHLLPLRPHRGTRWRKAGFRYGDVTRHERPLRPARPARRVERAARRRAHFSTSPIPATGLWASRDTFSLDEEQ